VIQRREWKPRREPILPFALFMLVWGALIFGFLAAFGGRP